jgi:TonB family protein
MGIREANRNGGSIGWMMIGIRIVVAIFAAPWFSSAYGQSVSALSQDNPNVVCIGKMEMPSYPPLAQQARISGTVMVDAVLSAAGSVTEVTVRADPNLSATGKGILGPPVAEALRGAAFNRTCAGKTVSIVFVFEIVGTSRGTPKQKVAFGSPNKFWIISEAQHWQP